MLFKETTVSGITVKNRIIRSATHDGLADKNGAPSDKLIAKYENLAKIMLSTTLNGYSLLTGKSPLQIK